MYEKNGIVTSPVVDANNVSIGTRKTLLSRKEVNVEAIFSFVSLQAFFLSEVVRSLYNWERLFRSERDRSPAAAGDEQRRASWLTIETPRSH